MYSANSGRSLLSFGDAGKGDGQLEKPVDVCFDGQGQILVLDEERLQVFNAAGEFVKSHSVKENLVGMTFNDKAVLLYDTYSVSKCVWKLR